MGMFDTEKSDSDKSDAELLESAHQQLQQAKGMTLTEALHLPDDRREELFKRGLVSPVSGREAMERLNSGDWTHEQFHINGRLIFEKNQRMKERELAEEAMRDRFRRGR